MITCLKSPARCPLLTPAVLVSNTVPSGPSFCWRMKIWGHPQNKFPLFGNLCFKCSIHAQEGPSSAL